MAADDMQWQDAILPSTTAFFLDVDGTLLGFKDRPEDVVADAELLSLLRRLRQAAGDAVALVSGRMISDLDRIVAPLVLPIGGVHGAELRFADGRREALDGEALSDVLDAAQAFVEARPGLRLEIKGGSTFAIHYRAAPDRKDEVASFLDEAIANRDLMVQHGKMVAEIKSSRCHKGLAIATLMETKPFAGRVPLFIGDDLTDEHGFQSVVALGGVAIKVGDASERTIAPHHLADVTAVRGILDRICRKTDKF
jgi:trehalose 6-phosphate phosphatase